MGTVRLRLSRSLWGLRRAASSSLKKEQFPVSGYKCAESFTQGNAGSDALVSARSWKVSRAAVNITQFERSGLTVPAVQSLVAADGEHQRLTWNWSVVFGPRGACRLLLERGTPSKARLVRLMLPNHDVPLWAWEPSIESSSWGQFNKRRQWLSSKDVNIGYNNGKELCRWAAWVSTAKVNTTVNVWHQYCRMMRVKILWPVRVKSSSGNDWCFGLKEFARVCLYLDSYVVVLIHSHRKPQANCSVTPVSSKQPTDAVCLWQAGKVSSR